MEKREDDNFWIFLEEKDPDKQYDLLRKELEEVRNESKQKCDEMGIDVSLIALDKLGNMGFKKELLGTNILAGLVEDVFYEKDFIFKYECYFSNIDYDFSMKGNRHFRNLDKTFWIYHDDFYLGFLAEAIGDSKSENKNINQIIFNLVKGINKEYFDPAVLKLKA